MKLNNFALQIRPGTEDEMGYVEIPHNTQYRVLISNFWNVRAIATLTIDGKFINSYVVAARGFVELETNESKGGKFTFLARGTEEFFSGELQYVNERLLGVVTVSIAPEKNSMLYGGTVDKNLPSYSTATAAPSTSPFRSKIYNTSYAAGGTGLTGQSNQQFMSVNAFPLDESERTYLNLRLIHPRVKPLKATVTFRGNPVPPPLD